MYKARQVGLRREVALKTIPGADASRVAVARFWAEAEVMAAVRHEHVVQVFELGEHAGRPFMAMELLPGGSLADRLRGGPLPAADAVALVERIARGVAAAHDLGVVHRDLKPGNVLLTASGEPKVTDFGLAKWRSGDLTRTQALMGTPAYMAPEQAAGRHKEIGPATDVYGLGAILYEMLTGRPPFRGANLADTLEQVRWADPAPPSRLVPRLPRDLATICLKCLQKAPARRYPTAAELADDLRRWLDGDTIRARPAPSWERLWRQVRRRPWEAATAAAVALLLALLVAGWVALERRGAADRVRDEQAAADRRVAAAERRAAAERLAAQTAGAERLRDRSEQALSALDGIRDMMVSGRLRDVGGLEPLKDELFDYYLRLNDQLRGDPGYDPVRLARSWERVGVLIQETGRRDRARDAFAAADELYRRAPDPAAVRPDRVRVLVRRGQVAFELNRDADARAACEEVAGLLAAGAGDAPAGCEADMWHLRGELAHRERRLADAVAAFGRAIELRAGAAGAFREPGEAALAEFGRAAPARQKAAVEHLRGLARGYGYLGDVYLDQRALDQADRAYWQSHRIREAVERAVAHALRTPPAPGGPAGGDRLTEKDLLEARLQLARSWGNFAALQRWCRAVGTARHFAEQALAIREEVSRRSPNNVLFRKDACENLNLVARLKLMAGDRAGVEKHLAESRLVPRDGSTASTAAEAESHLLLAWFCVQFHPGDPGRRAEAAGELRAARELLDQLVTADRTNPEYAFNRAAAYALTAELAGSGAAADRKVALEALEAAARNRFRGVHPDDVTKLRAFESLGTDPAFRQVLRRMAELAE